ncbi:thiamine diphosphokinase [Virgibacillus sp. AGTR]|uniref:thiamine diphosphokinase n=1 Tax=Virgibacillus sp. AGTR TaxID=2812055 RepID=UPI0019651E42|nr:thiamine diphosphokinase [Virgibacillus sp. AGTR]MCC2251906.1 thiamine diphosphokinase [Virgibacillus sp. AGTR]QRZ17361.1 thiamine diphosphokinase [Virgibacillus sp. AGTR]
MKTVAIIGNGPDLYPDFTPYLDTVDCWIGADRGAWTLVKKNIPMDYAVGDFDSTTKEEREAIAKYSKYMKEYSSEKDETDLEIALNKAFELKPDYIYLFGVTGGRLDHELINVQLLYSIIDKGIKGAIIDQTNYIELTLPGEHHVKHDKSYPNISFVPFSHEVRGITLTNFYYPLTDANISWGSTLCISNKLIRNSGTFSYNEGILLLIKSRDTIPR